MFDLRLIGGTASHFTDLQAEVLEMAANNAILLKHRIANSLKHTPPLGWPSPSPRTATVRPPA